MGALHRRGLIGAALALTACRGRAEEPPGPGLEAPPLKSLAPFPIGCAVTAEELADPAYAPLLARHFSQVTPEWQLKMEYVLKEDGGFRFDAPDAIAGFARRHGIRLFGHTLVWYAQDPAPFRRIDGQGRAFADGYRNYILAVAGRYRGQAAGWDVVNEAVAEDGEGLRDCLWSRNLGQLDYMRRAFDHAREADPGAELLINDYNLETVPKKRATFLKLVEDLLKAGAPVTGVGTQTHIAADLAPGALKAAIAELGSLGLKVHVSEIDVSLSRAHTAPRQERLYAAAAEAFLALPARQRFAFTVWGLRDKDSWLARENRWDRPLLFDDDGRAKATFQALAGALQGCS